MVRGGTVYRRCGRCGRTVPDPRAKRCPGCAGDRITCAYKVDIAPPGSKRVLRSASGFATKRDALEAMARLQTERLDGTYVERSKVTLGEYLDDWLAGGPTRGWKGNTARDYRVAVGHIKTRLADTRLQALNRSQIEALYGHLLTQGKRSRKSGDDTRSGVERKTVQNVHICLRAALNDAMELGVCVWSGGAPTARDRQSRGLRCAQIEQRKMPGRSGASGPASSEPA